MLTKTFQIQNATGIHARPAALIVNEVKKFKSIVTFTKDGNPVTIKSVIGLLGMGLEYNDQITINVTGEDEQAALSALEALLLSFAEH